MMKTRRKTLFQGVKEMNEVHGKHSNTPKKEEPILKGTFVSVLLVGVFIIVSWVAVYLLFILR
jgi:hypothetical protein